ncbi:Glycogen synthase, ADP-glucose transglucosylase [Olavius algarvensis spirochete endosymbiont]|nr:Glycogen synthase, ADP-glucose transglucosylase [Olavius algarvensis spirochete endosymbiont]
MISSEVAPLAKVGGLADAVPALCKALYQRGHDVRILIPMYSGIDENTFKRFTKPLGVPMGPGEMWCAVHAGKLVGTEIPLYALERRDLYDREGIYGPDGSNSWPDNALRYGFLCAAALQLCRSLNWIPDIFHVHDWPTAPLAWLLKNSERNGDFERSSSILTIHNIEHQGVFPSNNLLIFSPRQIEAVERNQENSVLFMNSLNFLVLGLKSADEITTVSPSYAREILSPELAGGLDEILISRKENITGILNGMDYHLWDPANDEVLKPDNYDRNKLYGKVRLKARLQKEAGLDSNPDIPVFGMVTRLTSQKGVELLTEIHGAAMKPFRDDRAQLVVLGTGETVYENAFRAIGEIFKNHCSVRIAFDDRFSRLIEAGSDFFLMPSRYEPCGLNQMYSMRYGTLPIVRRTGGLADTVIDISESPRKGDGFVFDKYSNADLANAINRAIAFHRDKRSMHGAIRRGMKRRFNWKTSVRFYLKVYKRSQALRRTEARRALLTL